MGRSQFERLTKGADVITLTIRDDKTGNSLSIDFKDENELSAFFVNAAVKMGLLIHVGGLDKMIADLGPTVAVRNDMVSQAVSHERN